MANLSGQPYPERQFNNLSGLNGLSAEQIDQHLKLYAGYVKNTNLLNEQLGELIASGDTTSPKFGELTRRMGFEYNGMRLHEYYFDNMSAAGGTLDASSSLAAAINANFGSVDVWKSDFTGIGKMRGVGWAVLAQDPLSGKLSNHWITLHEEGNVVGFQPILVMDVWEHAYTVDYKPTERAKYIDAFCSNICWKTAGSRLSK
ncbi:MAG TPA: Fe-Mn family superoxide dismutase [Blastocatellia bacterium]|nr:Fe-Mn family superoxide dismutase [Blastocatellia bacterium]